MYVAYLHLPPPPTKHQHCNCGLKNILYMYMHTYVIHKYNNTVLSSCAHMAWNAIVAHVMTMYVVLIL